jgi:two-component system KDP operon response regulator KdpE
VAIRVLIVEDDRDIRSLLHAVLTVEGFEISTAVSVSEARAMVEHEAPDLILLDLGLPDGRGEDLLAAWRTRAVPIIVVSAREDEAGKIALLDAGADDYLVKPFGVGELLARMRVALRHRGTSISPAQTTYELEGLSVDLTTHRVTRDGVEIKLTATEFKLLARLVQKAGQVVTHRQLLIDVWGADYAEHTHYVRVYMGNLRAKLERDPTDPRYVRTEVGVGYRLAVE